MRSRSRLRLRHFLRLDDRQLRVAGFSGQKTQYCRNLARAVIDGRPRPRPAWLAATTRRSVAGSIAIKGIGAWTADIYLIMALGRPDIWPLGDIALAQAARELKRLPARPSGLEMTAIGEELATLARGRRPRALASLPEHAETVGKFGSEPHSAR